MNETKSSLFYYVVLVALFLSAVAYGSYYDSPQSSQKKRSAYSQKYSQKPTAQAVINQ